MSTSPDRPFGTRKPRFNHVAMSLPPDLLDEEHRKLLVDFYGDVFGFDELPMLTEDRHRLVFRCTTSSSSCSSSPTTTPMTCPRLDHFGLSVGDRVRARRHPRPRAKAWQARDDRVDIIDKKVDDHGMLAITSIYVGYLLPDDGRDPVVGLQARPGASA